MKNKLSAVFMALFCMGTIWFMRYGDQTPLYTSYAPGDPATQMYADTFGMFGQMWAFFLALVLYLFAVCSLGSWALEAVFGLKEESLDRFLLGFFPGYLMAAAINRVLTLGVPMDWGCGLICAFWGAAFLYFARDMARKVRRGGAVFRVPLPQALAFTGLVFVFLVMHILALNEKHFMVGHATTVFLALFTPGQPAPIPMGFHLDGPMQSFPLFDQHYDEGVFLFPFMMLSKKMQVGLALWWIVNSFGKAVAVSLVFWFFRRFGLEILAAVIGTLYFWIGGNSLSPLLYRPMMDAGWPALITVHLGRVMSFLLIPFLVAVFCGKLDLPAKGRRALTGLTLLTMGLASTSFHNMLYVFAFLPVLALATRKAEFKEPSYQHYLIVGGIIIGLFLLTFALGGQSWPFWGGVPLFLAACLGGVWMLRPSGGLDFSDWVKAGLRFRPLQAFAVVAVLSCTLLGNAPTRITLLAARKVGAYLGWTIRSPATRNLDPGSHMTPFRAIACSHPAFTYCLSFLDFLSNFGLILLFTFVALAILSRAADRENDRPESRRYLYYVMWCLVAFCFAMFCRQFIYIPYFFDVVRSRFLEVPYFGLFFLGWIAVFRCGSIALRRFSLGVATVWSVAPLIYMGTLGQWWVNLRFWFGF